LKDRAKITKHRENGWIQKVDIKRKNCNAFDARAKIRKDILWCVLRRRARGVVFMYHLTQQVISENTFCQLWKGTADWHFLVSIFHGFYEWCWLRKQWNVRAIFSKVQSGNYVSNFSPRNQGKNLLGDNFESQFKMKFLQCVIRSIIIIIQTNLIRCLF
jgi:hypothetical protein